MARTYDTASLVTLPRQLPYKLEWSEAETRIRAISDDPDTAEILSPLAAWHSRSAKTKAAAVGEPPASPPGPPAS